MIDSLLHARVPAHRIWMISDLQQKLPEQAEECLDIALTDLADLRINPTAIWYLGDAMEGNDRAHASCMTAMQIEKLGGLNLPLRFVMGNHDLDCTQGRAAGSSPVLPAWEAFRKVPGWKTTAAFSDFFFTERLDDLLIVFLSDHIAPDHRWIVTHQVVYGPEPESYSIPLSAYQALRNQILAWKGPVILAGHYAFPGGARGTPPGGLLNRLLPLPENVKLILHGHSHIGDWVYGREKTFQRIGWVDWHDVPQINVSSLDRTRGSQSRSAFLDIHADGSLAVFFRDHEDRVWSDAYFTNVRVPRTRSENSQRHHREHTDLSGTALVDWNAQHSA